MNTYRTNAVVAGVLFITGTVMGVLSVVLTSPILDGPGYLARAAVNPTPLILGAFCVLAMGLVLAMVPLALFPILKRYSEPLAVGYLVFRGALETVTALGVVASWLLLITLGQQHAAAGRAAAAGSSAGADFQALAAVITKSTEISSNVGAVVFPIGAMMLYVLLYRSRLVPRWLSVWGMIAVVLHLALTGLAGLANLSLSSPVSVVANAPILVQEMAMAVWFIAKGFNLSASGARPDRAEARELLSAA